MWVRSRATHPTPAKVAVGDVARAGDRRVKAQRPLARTIPTAIRHIDRSGSDTDDNDGSRSVGVDAHQTKTEQNGSRAAARANARTPERPARTKGPIAHMVALSGPDASVRAARARHDHRPATAPKAFGERARPEPIYPTPRRPAAHPLPVCVDAVEPMGGRHGAAVAGDGTDGTSSSGSESRSHSSESDEDADDDNDDGYEDDADERTGVTDWGGLQAMALERARADATREQRRTAHALADGLVGLRSAMERAWLRSVLVPPAAVAEVEARAQAFLRAGCCCAWEPAVAPLGASLRALVAQLGIDRPQEPTPCFVALLDALVAAVRLVVASDATDLGRVSDNRDDDDDAFPPSAVDAPQEKPTLRIDRVAPKDAEAEVSSDNFRDHAAGRVKDDSEDDPYSRVGVPVDGGVVTLGPVAKGPDCAGSPCTDDASSQVHDVDSHKDGDDVGSSGRDNVGDAGHEGCRDVATC
ncbi:hypothetical protein psal_cds_176 [Pandoravirus salinus]|uniref:Uncharacterized protein n=1 Tax=Pandoravirus salinus TaxID=1349410 RepID=S4VTM2_9VIRU|nr:hypothetical protein psal_cds_176 [Pandoravirus salinus]AGO83668.1 hypothetical protein psal_cds_176 [Pandoravirus salinus]